MSDENLVSGIKSATDSKLNQECQVRIEKCFKQPFRKSQLTERIKVKKNAIIIRRMSRRLQGKEVACMKEPSARKLKKKAKTPDGIQLDKEVEPPDTARHNLIVSNEPPHTVHIDPIVSNEFNLSDDEIVRIFR